MEAYLKIERVIVHRGHSNFAAVGDVGIVRNVSGVPILRIVAEWHDVAHRLWHLSPECALTCDVTGHMIPCDFSNGVNSL